MVNINSDISMSSPIEIDINGDGVGDKVGDIFGNISINKNSLSIQMYINEGTDLANENLKLIYNQFYEAFLENAIQNGYTFLKK